MLGSTATIPRRAAAPSGSVSRFRLGGSAAPHRRRCSRDTASRVPDGVPPTATLCDLTLDLSGEAARRRAKGRSARTGPREREGFANRGVTTPEFVEG